MGGSSSVGHIRSVLFRPLVAQLPCFNGGGLCPPLPQRPHRRGDSKMLQDYFDLFSSFWLCSV